MKIPRSEYPRPQFTRPDWLCLNGQWQFEIDHGDSGLERGLHLRDLKDRITVPFCPESSLSGIGNVDFMAAVWYRRAVTVPKAWKGRRILLHFQACDYDATVWIDGVEAGRHRGGFTPFTIELGPKFTGGSTLAIAVRARDYAEPPMPRGKQSQRYENHRCHYTRTTGIWQTVWLEPVPECNLQRPRITPDVARGLFHLRQPVRGNPKGLKLRATLRDSGGVVATVTCPADAGLAPSLELPIPKSRRRVWEPADPHLYHLDIELIARDGSVIDKAASYAGLRGITIDGMAVKINGKTIFQRLVLDQGYYPDGILTAPSEKALVRDIELSLAAGFNGARLHQKVFEERFLYHCDRLGYLVWGEFADWGCSNYGPNTDHQKLSSTYITQWLEALERDYSHPAIIGWCPLNETRQVISDRTTPHDETQLGMFLATKAMDPTRPVLDTSGYAHRVGQSDIYDSHDYEQDPAKFKKNHAGLAEGQPFLNTWLQQKINIEYGGQPFFVSEFGGIWWNPNVAPGEPSWGYGDRPKTIEEFYARFESLCAILLDDPKMFGYCYTQLTDVFQEQNGIYAFDRSTKFDMKRIRKAQERKAAIEQLR